MLLNILYLYIAPQHRNTPTTTSDIELIIPTDGSQNDGIFHIAISGIEINTIKDSNFFIFPFQLIPWIIHRPL